MLSTYHDIYKLYTTKAGIHNNIVVLCIYSEVYENHIKYTSKFCFQRIKLINNLSVRLYLISL